jgi:transposase
MPRSLKTRKPRTVEVRQLHSLWEDELTARQRRRAEASVLHAAGLEAAESARALAVHGTTVYSDLRAVARSGVASVRHRLRGGAPGHILPQQSAESLRLAETPPGAVGLPFGRWSLAPLREYLLKRRGVRALSREHLRRVLRNGGGAFGASSASSSATPRAAARSWRASAGSGSIRPAEACCCFSTSGRFQSRPRAGGASRRPRGSYWRRRRRRAAFSLCSSPTRSGRGGAVGPSTTARAPSTCVAL